MADMDGFKEAAAYGLDKPQTNTAFFLKGNENKGWGVKNRLSRIFNPKTGRTVMLACDHGFIMGPTSGLERVDLAINPLIEYADCLMCTRGILRSVIPPTISKPVCLRSDGGTTILTELNLNRVYDVEDVVRVNASAMAVMVACGDKASEQITTHNLVHTVDIGEKLGIPVLGVTAVGKDMARDARYFRLATRVCAENGASFVKTYYTEEGFETVVAQCPVPIVIAGGKKLPEDQALELAYRAVQAGAAGVDMGRNVFQSAKPLAMMKAISAVVHQGLTAKDAFQLYNDEK
ncbi:MAG: 3-hydroxy-5-phosphonooxypentane-2,4-dione thiolase [Kiritimatiellae bacterium]|jgi:putative autoinducer-2 (AI-2) aldolase|nr:3-hydroxy-5-phosphonooxypentane-2,4-dione thiolase [Kiritimatiellia bacterium]